MAEKNNATCSICGKGYHMCISCEDYTRLNPWKLHTDTSEHYKIYQILHGVSTNVYTKEEAKERFKNVDLSDLEDLRDNIKAIIKDIIKEDEVEKEHIKETEVVSKKVSYRKKVVEKEPELEELTEI